MNKINQVESDTAVIVLVLWHMTSFQRRFKSSQTILRFLLFIIRNENGTINVIGWLIVEDIVNCKYLSTTLANSSVNLISDPENFKFLTISEKN